MGIISQNTNNLQDAIANVLGNIPAVLAAGESCLYYLVKELNEELENFIQTRKTDVEEFHVFSDECEQAMLRYWKQAGLSVTYRCQQITYMRRTVSIKYFHVANPESGACISLIPWFMLHGRPYPVFVYIYAVWHYINTGKKSMQTSAAAAGKIFGIDGFNKSTLSRNMNCMEQIFDIKQIGQPLSAAGRAAPSAVEMAALIPEILKSRQSAELLAAACGGKIKAIPGRASHTGRLSAALGSIPQNLSNVIKAVGHVPGGARDMRKRPKREHKSKGAAKKREPGFAMPQQLEQTRIAFIAVCRDIVMDAAIKYHCLII